MDQSKIHLPGYNRGRQRATSVILTLPLLLPPPFVVLTDAMLLSLIILLTTTGWPPHYSQTEVHQVPPPSLHFNIFIWSTFDPDNNRKHFSGFVHMMKG